MDQGDIDRFHTYGSELATAVEAALPGWVRRSIERFLTAESLSGTGAMDDEIDAAGADAVADVGPRLRELLALDIDRQWTNPLSVLRTAVVHPTRVLAAHDVQPVERDRHDRRIHPDDAYGLTPANFAEFGPEVHEQGILWGAAKAHLHLQQRKHG